MHFLSIKAQPTQLRCSCLTVSTCPVCSHTCARGVGASAGRLRSVVLLRRGVFGLRKGKGEDDDGDDGDGVCVCETAVEGPACVQGQGTVGSLWS